MSKEDRAFAAQVVAVIAAIVLAVYGVVALLVGITNAQNVMNWCQFKDGLSPVSSTESKPTGRRWSPNPATTGLTGECINPGDKGL